MNIAEFSTKNPVTINLIMAAILIAGFMSAIILPRELFPSIELEIVTIDTAYVGASAEDIEKLVSIPIEDEISDITGITVIRSVSSEGRSHVVAEIDPREDVTRIAEEIRTEVANMKGTLPEDAEDSIVKEVKPRFPVISISIAGDVPREELRSHAIELRDKMKLVDGVESVVASGLGDPVFWVKADPGKMYQYDIGIEHIASAIRNKNLDLPGGAYEQGDVEFLIRTRGKVQNTGDLLNIPVRRSPRGRHVLLGDIATVELGEEKTLTTSRVNGLPAITFWINKQQIADAVETVERVREKVEKFKRGLPRDIEIFDSNDSSYWVKQRFKTMVKSGVIGLVIVLIVLASFLDRRSAAMAALGIPVSFFGAFILMHFSNITLNVLSMFGLIMVLGIIVDDAIIVVENIQRYIQGGLPPREAAVKGTMEVARPVVAAILTNIAAFLPLLLATGLIGKFISFIPMVAIFVLVFSLVEAMLILPSHCADFLKPHSPGRRLRGWVFRFRSQYLKALFFVLRFRYVVTASFLAILILMGAVLYKMPLVLFYARDINQFVISVKNPTWSSLDDTKASVAEIEEVVRDTAPSGALKNTVSMIGMELSKRAPEFGDHLSSIFVEFEDFDKRKENGLELMREMRSRAREQIVGPIVMDFIKSGGPPAGKPVDVRIQGKEFDTLEEITAELEEYLGTVPGVHGVSDDIVWGKPEVRIEVNEPRAALYGLDTVTVARAVRAAVDGLTVGSTRLGREEADIVLLYDFSEGDLLMLLETYQIYTSEGGWVPLGAVADLTVSPSKLSISRYDMERAVSVTSEIDQSVATASEVNSGVEGFLNRLLRSFPGYTFSFSGEEAETRESMRSIFRASWIAILLIYIILASILKSYFQPLIIMAVLPFTAIGVAVGILIRSEPLTFPALIGIVALLGIVINDSLLLVDFINQRKKKMGRIAAVVMSSKHRFRPIILTTVTTFGGLISLMYHTRGEAAFLAPMAVALGFGLVFATIITLFLIPSLYLMLDDAGVYLRGEFKRLFAKE